MNMTKRMTVGFIVSGIMDDFTERLCHGVMDKAALFGVNLVVIPVKYIDRDINSTPDKYEYQYKTNAKNITDSNLDGLIVAADCVGCLTDQANLNKFLYDLPDVPTVLVASQIEGFIGANFDNTKGIKDGLEYLAGEMGIRKFCMLRGSDNYADSRERFEAFMEVMEEHNITIEDKNLVDTDLSYNCRDEILCLLEKNPDMEAVFCVNDAVALRVYDVLRECGKEPGRDVKVLGFDNLVKGSMITPSLSTVDANATDLGARSFEMLIRLMNGERPNSEKVPTRFILRESIAGKDSHLRGASEFEEEMGRLTEKNIGQYIERFFYRYKNIFPEKNEYALSLFSQITSFILGAGCDAENVGEKEFDGKCIEFKNLLDLFFEADAIQLIDVDGLIEYIDMIHGYEKNEKSLTEVGEERLYRLLSIFTGRIFKALSGEFVKQGSNHEKTLELTKMLIKDTMNFTYGNDMSYMNVVSSLRGLGVKNAYVYIYEKPIAHMIGEDFKAPVKIRLKAAMTDGELIEIPYSKQLIDIDEIFENDYVTTDRYSMVIMPLFFNEVIYGVILHDLSEITFTNGEFLVNQFSTAVRVIDILRENDEIQKKLEEHLAVAAENNIKLDNLSKKDVLTGILNRRGFYDKARKATDRCRENDKDFLVAYVDMNNLKIINDRFGHDDGDFALKGISEVLCEVIGDDGVVGRIGGDEYAFIYWGNLGQKELRAKINRGFDVFNQGSDKLYNVTVSCGFCAVLNGDSISLEDSLANADQDLYVAKRLKDNRIMK